MKVVFISNFINHHQLPLSNALQKIVGIGNYLFIATTPPAKEQLLLGYEDGNRKYPFVLTTYDKRDLSSIIECVTNADLVIWGGAPHNIALSLLRGRIDRNKIIFRYSERIFKNGIWKAFNPLRMAYMLFLHTRFRKKPMYMLCASAYLPCELSIFKAYPEKMFKWGYFPPFINYNLRDLIEAKKAETVKILWVGRLIKWKHPEVALEVSRELLSEGFVFHMNIIGRGDLEPKLRELIIDNNLSEHVKLLGAMPPEVVRQYMKNSDILIATSDFHEGWGVIINEAMNSGCVVVASHAIGSVPFLIHHNQNGYIYKNGKTRELIEIIKYLFSNPDKRHEVGMAAYSTISDTWNAENAASRLIELYNIISINSNYNFLRDSIYDGPGSIITFKNHDYQVCY